MKKTTSLFFVLLAGTTQLLAQGNTKEFYLQKAKKPRAGFYWQAVLLHR